MIARCLGCRTFAMSGAPLYVLDEAQRHTLATGHKTHAEAYYEETPAHRREREVAGAQGS